MEERSVISRRSFIKEAGIGALSLAAAGTLAGSTLAESSASASASGSTSASAGASGSASASANSAGSTSASASASAQVDERYTADLTALFADDAAFEDEAARIEAEDLPTLQKLAQSITDVASLITCLEANDAAEEAVYACALYAKMRFSIDSSDSVAVADMGIYNRLNSELAIAQASISSYLLGIDEQTWQEYLTDKDLDIWHRYLQTTYDTRDHVLSASEEELLEGANTAVKNVNSLFTTFMSSSFYHDAATDPDGNEIVVDYPTYSVAQESGDRDWRQKTFETYVGSYSKVGNILAANLETFVKLTDDIAVAHRCDDALDQVMIKDELSVDIFDGLIARTRENLDAYAEGVALRTKALGLEEAMPWDCVVPWAATPDVSFTYEDAQNTILEALTPLGDDYAAKLEEVFAGHWIDVYPADGKSSGAVTRVGGVCHPYITMNYMDDFSSMSTLAHELGHLLNYEYITETQKSSWNRVMKILVTEVASITNQVLLMDHMIANAKDDAGRLFYLSQEITLIESALFRQVMFATFEQQMYQTVSDGGTLTSDDLDARFKKIYAEFSPGITVTDDASFGWSDVPHFYLNHYVQNYAFAITGALSVATSIESGDKTAVDNYLEFLKAGNSMPASELYAKIDVDLTGDSYLDPLVEKYRTLLAEAEALL